MLASEPIVMMYLNPPSALLGLTPEVDKRPSKEKLKLKLKTGKLGRHMNLHVAASLDMGAL